MVYKTPVAGNPTWAKIWIAWQPPCSQNAKNNGQTCSARAFVSSAKGTWYGNTGDREYLEARVEERLAYSSFPSPPSPRNHPEERGSDNRRYIGNDEGSRYYWDRGSSKVSAWWLCSALLHPDISFLYIILIGSRIILLYKRIGYFM